MTGVEIIAAERKRQIEVEGMDSKNDDKYKYNELVRGALSYATPANQRELFSSVCPIPTIWPWSSSWWKPTPNDRIKELAKAGALLAAEIDRLKRASDLIKAEVDRLQK